MCQAMFLSLGRMKDLLFMGTNGREMTQKNILLSLPPLGILKLYWVGTVYLKISHKRGPTHSKTIASQKPLSWFCSASIPSLFLVSFMSAPLELSFPVTFSKDLGHGIVW